MSVPKGKRKLSRFEAAHHFYRLRQEVTDLILNDFGFSEEKYRKKLEQYRQSHANTEQVQEVCERWENKTGSFVRWYIDEEGKTILNILREIEREFTLGNSIFPSETPAGIFEFIERRKHMNRAIGLCYTLKQEMHYVIRTLPVDLNRYKHYAEEIEKQIALYKGVRQSDNRLYRPKKSGTGEIAQTATSVFDVIAAAVQAVGRAEEE